MTRVAIHIRDHFDPDAALRRAHRLYQQRWLSTARTFNGAVSIQGILDPEGGEQFLATLRALTPPPAPGDTRTPGARRADALVQMSRQAATTSPDTHGEKPHLTITLDWPTLRDEATTTLRTPGGRWTGATFTTTTHTGPTTNNHPTSNYSNASSADNTSNSAGNTSSADDTNTSGRGAGSGTSDSGTSGRRAATATAVRDTSVRDTNSKKPGSGNPSNGGTNSNRHASTPGIGIPIHPTTARRLACDATIIPALLNSSSQPLDIGHATRTIPNPIRHALTLRDGGCRFPGCDRPPAWTDAHHLTHWADGGPTSLTNLLLLCRHHHTTVHEGHWTLALDRTTGTVTAQRPGGSSYATTTPREQPP